jgi:glyoxylase-like metal-dependent hydrolase (beta-lactamase superfamily II)
MMAEPVPRQIAPGVHCLTVGRGALASNVYLVRSGESWSLLDTGWAGSAAAIRRATEAVVGPGGRPAGILLTHIHPDHSGSAGELARSWGVPVHVHSCELPMAAGRYLPEYGMPLDRWVVVPLMHLLPAGIRARITAQNDITDVARPFQAEAGVPGLPDWDCIHTPGHTPGHVAYFRPSDRVLISGDAVVTVDLNSIQGLAFGWQRLAGPPWYTTWDRRAAVRSITSLAALEPRILAPGHGEPLTHRTAQALHRIHRTGPSRGVRIRGSCAGRP